MIRNFGRVIASVALCGFIVGCSKSDTPAVKKSTILNVSFDPTREMYEEINTQFAAAWHAKSGTKVEIKQSHGGSGKQARSVMDGLEADVVSLALAFDVDEIAKKNLLSPTWSSQLPHNSVPLTSTVVFLVRRGNPKAVHDWDDLIKDGIAIVTPNPKTSGGARWNYLAAYGYAIKKFAGNADMANDFMQKLFQNAPVLDTGARGALTSFMQRHVGDVLITWESEAMMAADSSAGDVEIVVPSLSIKAEMPVAVVDTYAKKHEASDVAKAYLEFLFTEAAQQIGAKYHYRPQSETALKAAKPAFPAVTMLTIDDEMFGGWSKAHETHFVEGGVFDKIYTQQ